jgi:hypothetical protein
VVKAIRRRPGKARFRFSEIPKSFLWVAIGILTTVVMGLLLAKLDLVRNPGRDASTLKELLEPGLTPREAVARVAGRASVVGSDEACWKDVLTDECRRVRLGVLYSQSTQAGLRRRYSGCLTLEFDAQGRLAGVTESSLR